MLIQTIRSALARGEQVGAPSMDFEQMTIGRQRGSSFVARLLTTRALWDSSAGEANRTEWTEI